jgi:membrane protease YdiL (CAAX protease family)
VLMAAPCAAVFASVLLSLMQLKIISNRHDPVSAQFFGNLVISGLLAPPVEEMYFRGLLLTFLRRHIPLPAAFLVSSAAFAGLHLHLYKLGSVTFIGLLLFVAFGITAAGLTFTSKSLWPSTIFHSLYNIATALLPL